jgi:signal transduction histidine kinase
LNMKPHSLQNRLLLGILLCMTVLLLGGGVVVYRVIGAHVRDEADALLTDRLNFYRATLRLKANGLPAFNMAPAEWERISATGNPDLVQIWVADTGKEIPLRSPALTGRSLPRVALDGERVVFQDHVLWDGRAARLSSLAFAPPREDAEMEPVMIQLVVGRDLVELEKTLDKVRWMLGKTGAGLVGAMLLAAIRSSIEVSLSRTRKAEEYEATLESIWQSQQGMQRMVDNLLLLARLESGHHRAEFPAQPVSLARLLKRAWGGCLDVADQKGLRVSWQVDESGGDVMLVPTLFENVVRNFLENAAAYTPAGGDVRIAAGIAGEVCVLEVTNTNPGVSEAQLGESFSPFWRADPNASGHRGNAGIGLALCRRIAETLGGRVEAGLTEEGMVRYRVEVPVTLMPVGSPAPATVRIRESLPIPGR